MSVVGELYERGVVSGVLFAVVWALSLYVAYLLFEKKGASSKAAASSSVAARRGDASAAPAGVAVAASEDAFLASAAPVLIVYASVTGTG